jgi:outer membrane protein TolC
LAAGEARAQLALALADAEAARAVIAGWNADLARGRPVLPPLAAAGVVESPIGDGTHPRVLAIERELAAARLERRAARRLEALPELLAGWQRQEDGVSSLEGPVVGVSWRVPLADPNRGARAAAAARVTGSEARLEQARRTIRAEREATTASLRVLSDALAAAREAAAAVAPLVDGTVRAFELGEVEILELLDVLRSGTDARTRVLDLQEAVLAADRRLELLTATSP